MSKNKVARCKFCGEWGTDILWCENCEMPACKKCAVIWTETSDDGQKITVTDCPDCFSCRCNICLDLIEGEEDIEICKECGATVCISCSLYYMGEMICDICFGGFRQLDKDFNRCSNEEIVSSD